MFRPAAVVWMDEIQRTMSEHVRFVITQKPDDCRIDEGKPAASVGSVNDVLGVFHDESVMLGFDGEEQFHLLPFLQLPRELIHQLGVVIFQSEGFQDGGGCPVGRVDHEQGEQHRADRHGHGLLMVQGEEA